MKPTLAAVAAVLCAAAFLSACGSSSSSSSSSTAAAAGTGTARRTALAACLKQHGVTLPNFRPGARRGTPPYGAAGAGAPPTGGGAPPAGAGGPPAGGGFFGGGAGGARSTKFRAALKACGASFPARRRAAFSKTTLTKFVACVRAHGYQLPMPNTSGTGPVFPARIRTNAKFVKASRACASLLTPSGGAQG